MDPPLGRTEGRGKGSAVPHSSVPSQPGDQLLHTLVCRRQPASVIAMKACPGPRSGIDRSGSLSLVIGDIPSSIRRHSSFRRRPGIQKGWGVVRPPVDGKNRHFTRFSTTYAAFPRPQ